MENYSIKIKQEESGNDTLLAISINNIITYVLIDSNVLNDGIEIYHPDRNDTYFILSVGLNLDRTHNVTLIHKESGEKIVFYSTDDNFQFADKSINSNNHFRLLTQNGYGQPEFVKGKTYHSSYRLYPLAPSVSELAKFSPKDWEKIN